MSLIYIYIYFSNKEKRNHDPKFGLMMTLVATKKLFPKLYFVENKMYFVENHSYM
jgi:hypothetical protein